MSLYREEWERLVMEQIREYTDKLLASEDFSLACRSACIGILSGQRAAVCLLALGSSAVCIVGPV